MYKIRAMKNDERHYGVIFPEGSLFIKGVGKQRFVCCSRNFDRGIHVYIGYVDIEVNISVNGMFSETPTYKPIIEYFMCVKTEDDWEGIGYLGIEADVDWWSNRWKEELEKDMFLVLDTFVRLGMLNYNRPN